MRTVLCFIMSFTFLQLGMSSYAVVPTQVDEEVGGAYLVFAGKFGGDVTPEQVVACKELGVDGCAKGSKIVYYNIKIWQGSNKFSYDGKSHVLPEYVLTKLSTLRKGDAFRFTDVRAQLPHSKKKVDVHSLKFYVV